MKLLWVLMSGVVVNASFAAAPFAAEAGADRKALREYRSVNVGPSGKDAEHKIVQELEAPPAYATPTSKMSRESEALPPCTPLSVAVPELSTVEIVVVQVPSTPSPMRSVPPTPAPKPDSKQAAEFVDLRNGSTALAHVVAQAAAARDDFADQLGPVSTKWCLSHLTDQELERETSRARTSHQKWSKEYHDFNTKIYAEQQKIEQARNDQESSDEVINTTVVAAQKEIDRLNKLFIEHKKKPYPYFNTSLEHLEWAKKIREYNNSKAHLCCLDRWCESKPACCFSYCDCPRKEICKWSCLFLGGMAAATALMGAPFFALHT